MLPEMALDSIWWLVTESRASWHTCIPAYLYKWIELMINQSIYVSTIKSSQTRREEREGGGRSHDTLRSSTVPGVCRYMWLISLHFHGEEMKGDDWFHHRGRLKLRFHTLQFIFNKIINTFSLALRFSNTARAITVLFIYYYCINSCACLDINWRKLL